MEIDVIKSLTIKNFSVSQVTFGGPENRIEIKRFYPAFWGALHRQKLLLLETIKEIEDFKFQPKDYDSDIALGEDVRTLLKTTDTRVNALRTNFGDKLLDIRISIILFSVNLLEGLINEYIAYKCDSEKDFIKVERKGLIYKWTDFPKTQISTYNLDNELYESFRTLYERRRNLIVHGKSAISHDGEIKIKGTGIETEPNETSLLIEWCNIPKRLLENLFIYDKSESINTFKNSCKLFVRTVE